MARLARWLETGRDAVEWLTTALFFLIFAIFLGGVVARYVFATPLTWSDELTMVLFLWCTMLVEAFVSRDRDQVAFDLPWVWLSPRARRWVALARSALFALFFAIAFPPVLDYVLFLWRERTPALEWRLDVVYACFAVYMAMVTIRLAATFVQLLGPGWRDLVEDDPEAAASNVLG